MLCVLQMEYLAQMLSAVGIGVAPEALQSIKDEPSEHISGPITPPRVAVQPTRIPSTRFVALVPAYVSSQSLSGGPSGLLGFQERNAMQAGEDWCGVEYDEVTALVQR